MRSAWVVMAVLAGALGILACGQNQPGYRILLDGQPREVTHAEMTERLRAGSVTETTQVWFGGRWQLAKEIPELRELASASQTASAPPSAPVLASTGAATAVRVAMAYVPTAFPMGLSTQNGRGFDLVEVPDAAYRVLPARTGERLFGALTFGERSQLCVLETGGGGTSRLYLDRNGDGDLTNDPGPFVPEDNGVLPAFYTIELPWEEEAGADALKYRMWWFPSNMGGTSFYAACHRSGNFPYGDVPMVLYDSNADGDYANDPLYIDWNRDGNAAPTESYLMGDPIPVGSSHVRCVAIAHGGAEVAFASQ